MGSPSELEMPRNRPAADKCPAVEGYNTQGVCMPSAKQKVARSTDVLPTNPCGGPREFELALVYTPDVCTCLRRDVINSLTSEKNSS